MKISTHNGLEVWLEWRPSSSDLAANGEGEEQQTPWTRLGERPPRITTGNMLVCTGAVEIDVDLLVEHGAGIEYRLGTKEANYHDWRGDLRIEVKSNDAKVDKVIYLLPESDQAVYCPLIHWSPVSEDDLAGVLASRPGMSAGILDLIPEVDSGVGDEALKMLLESEHSLPLDTASAPIMEDAPIKDGVEGTTEPCAKETLPPPTSNATLAQAVSSGGSSLEITVYRGQYILLPPTPPPEDVDGDTGSVLHNGISELSFGKGPNEEWNAEDADGVAWCKFIYEVTTDSPPAPTSEPFILSDSINTLLRAQLAQRTIDMALHEEKKQKAERKAARQKILDKETVQLEAKERQVLEEAAKESLALVEKQKRSEAGKKGHQTKIANGLFKAKVKPTAPAIRRIQDQDRSIGKRATGVLKLRPDSEYGRSPVAEDRARQLGFGKSRSDGRGHARPGPSNGDRSQESPKSDLKSPKRKRSFISDGGQIILIPADEYDIPPPPRLKLYPRQTTTRNDQAGDRIDRKPDISRSAQNDARSGVRPKPGKLRRTDEPEDYGMLRAPRSRVREREREKRGMTRQVREAENYRTAWTNRKPDEGEVHRRNPAGREREWLEPDLIWRQEREERERRQDDDGRREKARLAERARRAQRDAQQKSEDRERRYAREQRERLEREEMERRLEEEEEQLGPMEEQVRAYEARERERELKRRKIDRQQERRKARGLDGSEQYPIAIPARPVKREERDSRVVGRGSRLSVRGAIIDMTELSD